jgi:cell division protein FtsB
MADRRPRSTRGTPHASGRPSARPADRPAPRGGTARGRATPGSASGAGSGSGAGPGPAPGSAGKPRPRLTGRAAILILLVAVLTVSYASSMRAYVQQRSHISDLKAEIAQRSSSIDDLEREKKRWKDPAFLEQQARERFGFVFPGETSYQVLDADGNTLGGADTLHDADQVVRKAPTAWWDTAWQSVEIAGDPAKADSGPAAPGQ